MSLEFNTKDLPDDCTLDDIKGFAASICSELSSAFDGYAVPSVVICLAQMLEVALANIEKETSERMASVLKEVPADSMAQVLAVVKGITEGNAPDATAITELHQSTGELMGHMLMMKLVVSLQAKLSETKVVMASTAMSFDERANSINELNELLDMGLSDSDKHKIRNQLKGGSSSPVDVKSGDELNDLCDDLFA